MNPVKKAQTVSHELLQQVVHRGVAVALETRKAAGVELSQGDVQYVSGGWDLMVDRPFPRGVLPYLDLLNPVLNDVVTNVTAPELPVVDAKQLGV